MEKLVRSPNYFENQARAYSRNEDPCCVCGKGTKKASKQKLLHVAGGGDYVVLNDAELAAAPGAGAGDCGFWPIGPDCLRQNPQLAPYVSA